MNYLYVRRLVTLAIVMAAAFLANPGTARAALIHFNLTSGTVSGTFSISTTTIPTTYVASKYIEYSNVQISFAKFPARLYQVTFFNSADHGGISIAAPGGGDSSVFNGPQVFAGLDSAPIFSSGSFSLTRPPYGAHATLTINAPVIAAGAGLPFFISAVPLPPGPPLFASALAGLGVFAQRRRRLAV